MHQLPPILPLSRARAAQDALHALLPELERSTTLIRELSGQALLAACELVAALVADQAAAAVADTDIIP